MMSRSTILLLLVCAIAPAYSLPSLKCPQGEGLKDKNGDPYGEAKPGECKKCADPKCNTCSEYYKKCDTCDAGYGFNSKQKCVPCQGKDCGVCQENYKKCEAKIAKCTGKIDNVATAANMTEWKKEGSFYYCNNEPGFTGSGYSSIFTGAVKNGDCIDCNGPQFRPYTDGDMEFCSFYYRARSVAANAFTAKSNCAYPGSIKFTLKRTCVSQKANFPFDINFVIDAKYCGKTKTIAVMGGGVYNPSPEINPPKTWEYAVKP